MIPGAIRLYNLGLSSGHLGPTWETVYEFYRKQSQDNGRTIVDYMPGRDTVLRYNAVVQELRSLPSRETTGTIVRLNHLGDQVLNDLLFEDYAPVNTGTLGTPQCPVHALAQSAFRRQLTCTNPGCATQCIRDFFSRRPVVITTQDITTLVVRALWVSFTGGQQPPGRVVEDIVATQLDAFMSALVPREFPPVLQRLVATNACSLQAVLRARSAARSALCVQCPSYTSLHAALLVDTLYFAGGVSIPQIIVAGLAVLYAPDSPLADADRRLDNVRSFVFEVCRVFPAVGFIPYHDMASGRDTLLCLRTALRDPVAWGGGADTAFRVRPTCQYEPHIRDVAWANAASGPGTDGRGCPATALSLAMLDCFFEAVQREQPAWELIPPSEPIRFGMKVTGMLGIRRTR